MKIFLNDKVGIDLKKLIVSRLLAVANSGGGKSWLTRRIVEQAFGKVQIIILDPEGEYSTLREKFDFILCGKGMDAPAEPRSAALLARKLLESKSSAIIDLYELHPQERKHFVRLFLESMINAPKALYNDCLIILDEAHRFAPEKEEAESLSAVIEMASLGRKRGFCLIPVTQRVSKLSKDVAAECNNKLMGRASLDLDRKRTADELGIRDKDEILALRNLEPGEFFAFGPAISNEVIKVKVGEVQTSMPKAGRQTRVAPPSARVKKELAALADLPQEAEEEARTVAELKTQNATLKRQLAQKIVEKPSKPTEIGPMGVSQWRDYGQKYGYWAFFEKQMKENSQKLIKQYIAFINKMLHVTGERAKAILDAVDQLQKQMPKEETFETILGKEIKEYVAPLKEAMAKKAMAPTHLIVERKDEKDIDTLSEKPFGMCEKKIYTFLYSNYGKKFTRIQIGAVTGYSPTSGGFNNAIARLNASNLISKDGDKLGVVMSNARQDLVLEGEEFSAAPEFWKNKLGMCERALYGALWELQGESITKEELGLQTGYSPTSGGFNNAVAHLNSIGLIRRVEGALALNKELLEV